MNDLKIIFLTAALIVLNFSLVSALVILPESNPIIIPGDFGNQKAMIINDDNVTRKVLLYVKYSESRVICFFDDWHTMRNLTLKPKESVDINMVYYILPETPSKAYSCELGYIIALSERMENDIDKLMEKSDLKESNNYNFYSEINFTFSIINIILIIIALSHIKKN